MLWHPAHTHLCLQTCLHETLASVALQQQPALHTSCLMSREGMPRAVLYSKVMYLYTRVFVKCQACSALFSLRGPR